MLNLQKHTLQIGSSILILLLFAHIVGSQESPLPFPWRFVQLAELETELPDALVSEYRAVTIDSNGVISLLDRITMSREGRKPFHGIHQFGSDGKWIRNIGRQGDGPGEFRSPFLINAAVDGSLLIFDTAIGNKFVNLSSNGDYLNSYHVNMRNLEAIAHAGIGGAWLVSIHPQPIPRGLFEPWVQEIQLHDNKGTLIWSRTYQGITNQIMLTVDGSTGAGIPFPNPAARMAHWAFTPDGNIWIISPENDQLINVNRNGTIEQTIEINMPLISLTRAEINEFINERTERFRTGQDEPYADEYRPLPRILRNSRGEHAPVQRFWWIGPEGFLVDRVSVDIRSQAWRENPGKYMALFPDGTVSEEYEGPGGIVAINNGYAVSIQSVYRELPSVMST